MKATRALCLILALMGVGGCVTGRAANARREPLAVPMPPPRVIAPVTEPEQPQQQPASDPEPVPPLPRVSRTSPPRVEPKPVEPVAAPDATETPATPAAPPAAAPSELRTVETPDDGSATRQVRDTLDRATGTLGHVDYRNLSQPAKLQYDMAKRFIEQAEEALKARNYTAAQLMAEKAETIAKELSGR